ncbi:hypothetical protein A2U01_0091602, partial [Trifolium medium]|nr:hypothetical protein [Trifolium medium]
AGGRRKHQRAARTQPQPEPQGDSESVAAEPVHVAEPHVDVVNVVEPHPDPAPATVEDDGEQLCEADFQEDDDAIQE